MNFYDQHAQKSHNQYECIHHKIQSKDGYTCNSIYCNYVTKNYTLLVQIYIVIMPFVELKSKTV